MCVKIRAFQGGFSTLKTMQNSWKNFLLGLVGTEGKWGLQVMLTHLKPTENCKKVAKGHKGKLSTTLFLKFLAINQV